MLAARQHHSPQRHLVHCLNHVPDHGKCINADLAFRSDVVRANVVKIVYFGLGNELINVNGSGALKGYGFKFLVRHFDVLAFPNLIATDDLFIGHFLAGPLIDTTHPNSIAGLTIDVVEPNLLSFGCGGVQGYRAGHQRQTEITFPIRSGGHRTLHSTRPSDSTTYVPCRSDPQSPRSSAIIPTYYPHDLSF